MHFCIRAALLPVLFCVCSLAADVALIGGTIYPSPAARPIVDGVIVIHDNRIVSVGTRASTSIRNGLQKIDCSGKFVVAGFWNSHVHIFTPGLLHVSRTSASELNKQLDAMLNRWGFTTVFDIASLLENTIALRSRIDGGELRGPRILTVGEPLWTNPPVYIRDYLVANHIDIPAVTTSADAAARVRAQAERGANGIKLFAGSVQSGGRIANMPLDVVRAAVNFIG